MDELISRLRYEYVQVLHDPVTGGDKDAANRIQKAIDYLYSQRADLMYIRPPSEYLRNSYPVTALQRDANNRWSNMLTEEALNGMPFSEAVRDGILDKAGASDARVTNQIDKTFWQNINRVRVAGAGRTNYVIAKDDVGNWYVKGYSADPEDIIKGVQQMASYAIGTPVNSTAIEQAVAKLQKQKGQTPSKSTATNPGNTSGTASGAQPTTAASTAGDAAVRQQQYQAASNQYASATSQLSQDVEEGVRQLNNDVKNSFTQHKLMNDELFALADECAKEHLAMPATRPASSSAQAKPAIEDTIFAELRAMKSYAEDLRGKLYAAERAPATLTTQPIPAPAAAVSAPATRPETQPLATEPANRVIDAHAANMALSVHVAAHPVSQPSALTADDVAQALKCSSEIVRLRIQKLIQSQTTVLDRYSAQLELIANDSNSGDSVKP